MKKPTIAVVGASRDHRKYGNKCIRAYLEAGYEVFPVHPREAEIEGLRAYPRLGDIDPELDRVSVYLPPAISLELVPEIRDKGAREVWFNPGSADQKVLEASRDAGLETIAGCSIVDIGMSPSQFP